MTSGSAAKLRCGSGCLLRASMVKSSCMWMARPNRFTRCLPGQQAQRRNQLQDRGIDAHDAEIEGTDLRCPDGDLTATSLPPGSRALCTWATEAEAMGLGELWRTARPADASKSCSRVFLTSSTENGPTSSW